MNLTNNRTDTAINGATIVLGAFLFIAPWLLGFRQDTTASVNAWISGSVVILLSLLAAVRTLDWEEWLNVIAGLWIAGSPWLLWFDDVAPAFWVHLLIGLCIVAVATVELWRIYLSPHGMTARR